MVKQFLEWAKTDMHKRRILEAKSIIARYREEKLYVATSGGKDSLALLHIVVNTIGYVDVFHWNHGPYLMPRKVERDILDCIYSIVPKERVHILTSNKLNTPRVRWDYKIWYRAFYGKLTSWIRRRGYRIAFLGLREEESITRRRRASRIVERKNNVLLVYPLHSWSYMDVWAYIFCNRIRFPKIYWDLAKIHGWDKARLVTFFDKEFEHLGNIEVSKYILHRHKEEYGGDVDG